VPTQHAPPSAADTSPSPLEGSAATDESIALQTYRLYCGNHTPELPVRDVILHSWRRSSAAGLSRESAVFPRVEDAELRASLERNHELLEVAAPHLEWISTFMAGVRHVAYLTDGDGVVLDALGDRAQIDALRLSPGHDRSEGAIGTNGAGTALAAAAPVAVIGPEHFVTAFQNCACMAAPVRVDGRVIGTIDVSTSVADATPDRLALVAHAAFVIERELMLRKGGRRPEEYRRIASTLQAREQELLHTNAQLEALLDNTTAVIYLVDADDRFLRINRRWETLFGLRNDAATGRSVQEFFPGETAERFIANNRLVFASGRPMEFEEEVLVHGVPRTFLSVKVPIFEASAAPYAICGISTDITERKAAEQQERRILRESSERKERFIAALSHELRNPIAAISAAAQVLQHDPGDAKRVEAASGIVVRQAAHVAQLVDQLHEASRVATRRLHLKKSPVDLRAVLEQALEAVRPRVDRRGQKLAVALPLEPLTVDGDATRLTQVFVNLLANASRYGGDGNTIWLTASRAGVEAVVAVRDEGCGIEREALPRIFELLFQANGARTGSGLGLGLALVRGIVEAHDGRVSAHSEGSGCGAEFVVRLPCAT
jgi:PAS domain S-box-containing protein